MTTPTSPAYRTLCLVLALLLAGATFVLARRALTFPSELRAWDTLFRARGRLPVRSDFVLVAGDETSIRALGQPPWPRRVYADVVRAVQRGSPRVIVLDCYFEERDRARRGSDAALWKAVANARNVFLPITHGNPGRQVTSDDLRGLVALEKSTVSSQFARLHTTPDYAWLGFRPPVSDLAVSARGLGVSTAAETADSDGVIRRIRAGWVSPIQYPAVPQPPQPSKLGSATGVIPGLPVIAAMFAFNVDKRALRYDFGERLIIGGHLRPPVQIPIDPVGHMAINFAGPAGSIPRLSLVDVRQGHVDAATFKSKVVFIGLTDGPADEVEPLRTPFGPMPRVEITANAVHSILERDYLFVETARWPLGYLMALAVLLGVLVPRFRPGIGALVTLLLLLAYLAVAVAALRYWHTLLPVLPAALLTVSFYVLAFVLRAVMGENRGPSSA